MSQIVKFENGVKVVREATAEEEASREIVLTPEQLAAAIAQIADVAMTNRGPVKALALAVLDEFNVLRDEINVLRNEIELLKGDSSLPDLPQRTPAQLKNAVENHSG